MAIPKAKVCSQNGECSIVESGDCLKRLCSSPCSARMGGGNWKPACSHCWDWAFLWRFLRWKWRARKRRETAPKAVAATSFLVPVLRVTYSREEKGEGVCVFKFIKPKYQGCIWVDFNEKVTITAACANPTVSVHSSITTTTHCSKFPSTLPQPVFSFTLPLPGSCRRKGASRPCEGPPP